MPLLSEGRGMPLQDLSMGDALNKVTKGIYPKQTGERKMSYTNSKRVYHKATQGVGGRHRKLMKGGCANNSDGK